MKLPKPHMPKITRDFARRMGWLLLTLLFIFTGLGVGVYAFWQDTHQNNTAQTQPAANSCQFDVSVSAPVEPAPAPYTPENDITQLITSDLVTGSGRPTQAGDCLVVKYYGTLVNGTVFDENFSKPTALQFSLGQGQVIPGWDEGLMGMRAGGTRRILIPAAQGYGNQAQGSIPANSNLIFVVKLISIK